MKLAVSFSACAHLKFYELTFPVTAYVIQVKCIFFMRPILPTGCVLSEQTQCVTSSWFTKFNHSGHRPGNHPRMKGDFKHIHPAIVRRQSSFINNVSSPVYMSIINKLSCLVIRLHTARGNLNGFPKSMYGFQPQRVS